MNLRDLRTFVAIVDQGGFKRAAERLGLTQSAVSMQIKGLERDLGVALFDREQRPATLTPTARRMVDRARAVLDAAEEVRLAALADTEVTGTLVLGVIPSVTTGALPRALGRLRTLYPDLTIRVTGGLSGRLRTEVLDGALDAAIVTGGPADPPPGPARAPADLAGDESLAWTPLIAETLALAVPRESPFVDATEALAHLPFIRFNRLMGVGQIIDAYLRDRGLEPVEAMELESIEAIAMMVAEGLGCAIVPVPRSDGPSLPRPGLASRARSPTGVRLLPLDGPVPDRTIGLVVSRTGTAARFVEPLVDALVGVLE